MEQTLWRPRREQRVFRAVARHLNRPLIAGELGLTQSAIFAQVSGLI